MIGSGILGRRLDLSALQDGKIPSGCHGHSVVYDENATGYCSFVEGGEQTCLELERTIRKCGN